MNTQTTAPYTADELYAIAAKTAAQLDVPEKWRDDAVQEFVVAAWRAGERSDVNPRAHQFLRGRGAILDFMKHEIMMEELGPGECPKGAERISLGLPLEGEGDASTLDETLIDPNALQPDAELRHEEREAAVRDALARLDPDQRTAAVSVWIEGRTQDEVAEAMKKTRQEIRTLLTLARRRLSWWLHDYKPEFNRSRY